MPVVNTTSRRPGVGELAMAWNLSHVLIAAAAARAGRTYRSPHPCCQLQHDAMKRDARIYAATTVNRRPWTAAGMEIAECPVCGTSICMRTGARA